MFTRKLFSVIDNIIVDVSEIICCSEPTDSFTVNVIVAELPGHKALQPGHVPRLPPPWRLHCPRCTKCNSPPIINQCINHRIAV